ncbi:MAG: Cytochrome c [Chloroflexi bacterium ADurb.Bin325]|nr:MAG: Cytochrome c [Chloroflexi bacterium ADurb.Bin325]
MTTKDFRWLTLLLLVILLVGGAARAQAVPLGQDPVAGQQIFQSMCSTCHTIGKGKLVGPDLAGVTERADVAWIKQFIQEPDKMLASGDPTATKLLAEFNNVAMPNLGLSAAQVDDVVAYLAAPDSAKAPAAPAGAAATGPVAAAPSGKAPSLAGYAPSGEALFSGATRLAAGGTPCIACHSVEGVGLLGGGTLGPDLTQVHTRYGGTGLAAALSTLPFPTMQSIFATRQLTPEEQADLLAFFARAAQQTAPQPQVKLAMLLIAGAGLTGALLVAMLFFWPRQRLSISQRLRQKGSLRQDWR